MRHNDLKFIYLFFILLLFARSCHTWGGTECRAHLYDQHNGGIKWGWRVDCEHKGITSVPEFTQDIKYIRTLNLSNNPISSLGGSTFTSLSSLTYVDLHHTQLRTINADTFKNLPRLRHLDLHDNKELTTIAKNSFAYLPNIQVIQLHDSGLTFVPEDFVNTRHHSLQVLSLGNNMFPCDCSISWLWKDYKDIYNILPRNLSGFHHTANTFKHHVGYIQNKFPPLTCYDPVNQQRHTFDAVDLSFCKDNYTGKWVTPWSRWLDCSCDTKTRYRYRECKNGEGVCPGPPMMNEVCSPTSCFNAGDWGEWSAWSLECSAECDVGIVNRTRPCIKNDKIITQEMCEGAEEKGTETKGCNYHPCVYGSWSEWSSWLQCSSKCRNGVTSRIRTCLTSAPSKGGVRCIGHNRERRNCTVACPEHFKKTLIDPFTEHKEQYNNIIRTARTWSQVMWTCILIQLFLMVIAVGSICFLYRKEKRTKNIMDTWDDIPDIIISSTSNSTSPITDSPESNSVNHLNIEYWIDIANECYMTRKDDANQYGMESVEYSTVQLEHDKPDCVVDVQPVHEEVPEDVISYCNIGQQDKGLEIDQNQVLKDEDTLESPPSNSHVIILPNRLQDGNMYSYEEQEQEDCMNRESLHRNSQHFLQQPEKQESQIIVDNDPHAITEKCSSEQLLETLLQKDDITTDIENNQKMVRKQPSIDSLTSEKVDSQHNLGESIGYETHGKGESMHHGPQYFLQPPQKLGSSTTVDSDARAITEKDLTKHPFESMLQDDHMRTNIENTQKMSKDQPTIDTSASDQLNYQQNLGEGIRYEKHAEGERMYHSPQLFLQPPQKQENTIIVDCDTRAITENDLNKHPLKSMLQDNHMRINTENTKTHNPSKIFKGKLAQNESAESSLDQSSSTETLLGSNHSDDILYADVKHLKVLVMGISPEKSIGLVQTKRGKMEPDCKSKNTVSINDEKRTDLKLLDKYIVKENNTQEKVRDLQQHNFSVTETQEVQQHNFPISEPGDGQQKLYGDISYERNQEREVMHRQRFTQYQTPPPIDSNLTMKNNGGCVINEKNLTMKNNGGCVLNEKNLTNSSNASEFREEHICASIANKQNVIQKQQPFNSSVSHKVGYQEMIGENMQHHCSQNFPKPPQTEEDSTIVNNDVCAATERDCTNSFCTALFTDEYVSNDTENTDRFIQGQPLTDSSVNQSVDDEQNFNENITMHRYGEVESTRHQSSQYFPKPPQIEEDPTIADNDVCATNEKDFTIRSCKAQFRDAYIFKDTVNTERFIQDQTPTKSSMSQRVDDQQNISGNNTLDLYEEVEGKQHQSSQRFPKPPQIEEDSTIVNNDVCAATERDCTNSFCTALFTDEYVSNDTENTDRCIQGQPLTDSSVNQSVDDEQNFNENITMHRYGEVESTRHQSSQYFPKPPQIEEDPTIADNDVCATNEKDFTIRSCKAQFRDVYIFKDANNTERYIQDQTPTESSMNQRVDDQQNISGNNTLDLYEEVEGKQHQSSQRFPKPPQIEEDSTIVNNDVCAATEGEFTNRSCKAQFRDEYIFKDTENTERFIQEQPLTDFSVNQRVNDEQNFRKDNTMDRYRERESTEHQSSQYFSKPPHIEEDPTIVDNDVCATNEKDFTTRSFNAQFEDEYVSKNTENTERYIQGQPPTASSMNQRVDDQQNLSGNNTLDLYEEVKSTQHQSSQRFPKPPQIREDPTIVDNGVCTTTEKHLCEDVYRYTESSERLLQEQLPIDASKKVDCKQCLGENKNFEIHGRRECTQHDSSQYFPNPPQIEEDRTIVNNDLCATTEGEFTNRFDQANFGDEYVFKDSENTQRILQEQAPTDSSVNQKVDNQLNVIGDNTLNRYGEMEGTQHQSSQRFPEPPQTKEDSTIVDNDACYATERDCTNRSCTALFRDKYVCTDTDNTQRFIHEQPPTDSSMNQRVDDQQNLSGNNTLDFYEEVEGKQHQSSQRFPKPPQIEEDSTIVNNDVCAATEGEFTNRFDQANFGDEYVFKDSENTQRILQEQAPTDSSVNQKVDNQLNVIGDNTLNRYGEMEGTQHQSSQNFPKPPQTEEDSTIVDNDVCAASERDCTNRSCTALFRDKYVCTDTDNTERFIQEQPLTDSSVNQRVNDEQNFSKDNTMDRYRERESTEHQSSQYFSKPPQIEEDPTIVDNDVCATNEKDFTTRSFNAQFEDEYVSKNTENTEIYIQGQPPTASSMNQRVDDQQNLSGNNTLDLYEEVKSTQHQSSQRFPKPPQIRDDSTIVDNGVCATTEKHLCEDVYRYTESSERLLQEQLPIDASKKVDCNQYLGENKNFEIHGRRECTQHLSSQYEEIENMQGQSLQSFSKARQIEESSIIVEGACCISDDNELLIDSEYDNLDLCACNSSCVIEQLIDSSPNACIEKSTDSNLLVSEAHMKGSWHSFHGEDDHDAIANPENKNNQDTTIFAKEKKKKKKRFKMLSKAVKATQRTFQRVRKSDKSKDENIKRKNSSSVSMLSCVQSSTEMEDKRDKIYRRTSEEASKLFPTVWLEKEVDSPLITGQTNSKKEEDCLTSLEVLQNTVKQAVPLTALTSDKRKNLAESSLVNTTTVYQPITFAPLPAKLSTRKMHATTKDAQLFVDSNHRHQQSDVRQQTSLGKIDSSACDVIQHTRQSKSDSSCLF